ncbi:CO1A1 protein, partial [Nothoprocta ornata]|nr:CO1A1 protein [Nothoprocta ornata]
ASTAPYGGNPGLCSVEPVQGLGWGLRAPGAPAAAAPVLPSLQLEYEGASAVQLRFLRLRSSRAAQQVSYTCRPRWAHGQHQPDKAVQFLADSRERRYTASLPGCVLDNDSSLTNTIFHFATEELALLPLRDLAVFHNGDASHHFGFTVGPVCFS